MNGADLKALRLSLGLTRAQAAILLINSHVDDVHFAEEGDADEFMRRYYGLRLKAWQAAGERKDDE